jgi:hypothetical protein
MRKYKKVPISSAEKAKICYHSPAAMSKYEKFSSSCVMRKNKNPWSSRCNRGIRLSITAINSLLQYRKY